MLGEAERCCHEVRFESGRCVKNSKCVCGRSPEHRWRSLQRSHRPSSWIWGKEGEWTRLGREKEGKGKEKEEGEGKEIWCWGEFRSLALRGIETPLDGAGARVGENHFRTPRTPRNVY